VLQEMPSKKKKCPHCDQFIYVRTRPLDKKRVLVTHKQAAEIELQWEVEQTHNELEQEYHAIKEEFDEYSQHLAKQLGREPSDYDVFWGVYTRQSLEFAKQFKWGLYRNTQFNMARILFRQELYKHALEMFFQVCYLDANGPQNCGTLDPDFLQKFPPFDPKHGSLAPGVLSFIAKTANKLALSEDDLREKFISYALVIQKNLQLPLSPKDIWDKVQLQLFLFLE
jgi:hypothetical protein